MSLEAYGVVFGAFLGKFTEVIHRVDLGGGAEWDYLRAVDFIFLVRHNFTFTTLLKTGVIKRH